MGFIYLKLIQKIYITNDLTLHLINLDMLDVQNRAVVRGGTGGTLAPPEFRVSERTEREIDSLLLSTSLDLKIEQQLWILHKSNHEGAVKFPKNS